MINVFLIVNFTIYQLGTHGIIFFGIPLLKILYNYQTTSLLDNIYKVAMIIIGIANCIFACYIFLYRNELEKRKDFENHRKEILNNMVLRYKLATFYDDFEILLSKSEELIVGQKEIDNIKILLDDFYQEMFPKIRKDFTEYLGAVDDILYTKVLDQCDDLQSKISENLFDEEIDFSNKNNFDYYILTPIKSCQRAILTELFNFK